MTELSLFRAHGELDQLLHRLGLSTFRDRYQTLAETSTQPNQSPIEFLYNLCVQENEHRDHIRRERLIKSAKLRRHKILKDFEVNLFRDFLLLWLIDWQRESLWIRLKMS